MKSKRLDTPTGDKKRTKNTKAERKTQEIIATKLKHPELTTREIGAMVGRDHSVVVRTLQRYGISDQGDVSDYTKERAQIFQGLQARILQSITDTDISKTPMIQKVTAASILYDKERLELGQSTSNISVASIMADNNDLDSKIQELESALI